MIQVLVGTIASGKSTYCRRKAHEGWLTINDDDILNMLHAGEYPLYDEKLKPLYKSIEDSALHAAILCGKDVIIDRGVNIRRVSRMRWIAIGHAVDVRVEAVVFPFCSPKEHSERRMNSDPRGLTSEYWTMVAEKHISQYEQPVIEEGFDAITIFR